MRSQSVRIANDESCRLAVLPNCNLFANCLERQFKQEAVTQMNTAAQKSVRGGNPIDPGDLDDAQLAAALLDRDEGAWREFVRRFGPVLRHRSGASWRARCGTCSIPTRSRT
jgi:hypothetical protein